MEAMADNQNNNNDEGSFIVLNLSSEGEEQVRIKFKESIDKLLESSSEIFHSTLFVYIKMVCYFFENNKSFQDFVDLLADSVEEHVEKYKNALHGVE